MPDTTHHKNNNPLPRSPQSDSSPSITLTAPKDFRFSAVLRYLARSDDECLHRVYGNRVVKAMPFSRGPCLVEIGTEKENRLTIRLLQQAPDPEQALAEAGAEVSEWFGLDEDLSGFYALAEKDPLLGKAVAQNRGLRIVGRTDLFEALTWAITGQQIALAFACQLKRRFVTAFGTKLEHDGETYWLFPEPARIAELPPEALTDLKLSRQKTEAILTTARLMADGTLTKARIREIGEEAGIEAAEQLLTAQRGVGPWTAHYVLLHCLRMPDAFPIGDAGLHNAVKKLQGLDRKPTRAELLRLAEAWTGWRACATFYLWQTL